MNQAPLTNAQIAAVFSDLGERQKLIDFKPFRAMAYLRAADTFRELPQSIAVLSAEGRLGELDGVGPAIVEKVESLIETGSFPALDEARAVIPDGLVALTRMPGIGPATAKRIWDGVAASSLDDVVAAATDGSLTQIPKVTAKISNTIREYAELQKAGGAELESEYLRDRAQSVIAAALEVLHGCSPGSELVPLGDLAGGAETVINLSALVWPRCSEDEQQVFLTALANAGWGVDSGTVDENNSLSVVAPNGPTLRIVIPATETERDDLVRQAESPLTGSIRSTDLVADLHCHSTWSDGKDSILAMARAALAQGDTHLVITDHSAPYALVGGLDGDDLLRQAEEVAQVNQALRDEGSEFVVLRGSEVEILADGTLGLPDEVLASLDWVMASIHVSQRQSADQLQHRMERVLTNPHVDCIGHPTSRLLLQRPSTALDVEWLIERAAQTGVALELNANPRRLDLGASWCAAAAAQGVPISINSDAHSTAGLALRSHGVMVARRAGLSADQVVNCWSMDKLVAWTQRRSAG